jgi:hypothetical protein
MCKCSVVASSMLPEAASEAGAVVFSAVDVPSVFGVVLAANATAAAAAAAAAACSGVLSTALMPTLILRKKNKSQTKEPSQTDDKAACVKNVWLCACLLVQRYHKRTKKVL